MKKELEKYASKEDVEKLAAQVNAIQQKKPAAKSQVTMSGNYAHDGGNLTGVDVPEGAEVPNGSIVIKDSEATGPNSAIKGYVETGNPSPKRRNASVPRVDLKIENAHATSGGSIVAFQRRGVETSPQAHNVSPSPQPNLLSCLQSAGIGSETQSKVSHLNWNPDVTTYDQIWSTSTLQHAEKCQIWEAFQRRRQSVPVVSGPARIDLSTVFCGVPQVSPTSVQQFSGSELVSKEAAFESYRNQNLRLRLGDLRIVQADITTISWAIEQLWRHEYCDSAHQYCGTKVVTRFDKK